MAAILCTVLGVVICAFAGLGGVSENNRADRLRVVQLAVERTVVQCYALEGAYPPNIEYLEDNYGLIIDHDRYFVHYKVDASNIMPDVEVMFSFKGKDVEEPEDYLTEDAKSAQTPNTPDPIIEEPIIEEVPSP